MASIISAGTTSGTALNMAGDTSGVLELATNGSTTAVTIDTSQNVGIGTTSPNCRAHFQGGTNSDGSLTFNNQLTSEAAYNTPPSVGTLVSLKYNSSGSYAGMGGWSIGKENATDGNFSSYLALHTRTNGGSTTERMRIDSSGNVLVGTTTAIGKFTLTSSGNTSGTNALSISNSSGTELFYIRDDGAFRTGKASVSPYNNTAAVSANAFINTDGTMLRATSSLKYKKDIENASYGLSDVLKLRPVTYKGLNLVDGDKVYGGLIAEEVHDAGLTQFVQYAEDGSPDALAYGNMVSLLTKAIQEQQTIINDLTARITALEGAA